MCMCLTNEGFDRLYASGGGYTRSRNCIVRRWEQSQKACWGPFCAAWWCRFHTWLRMGFSVVTNAGPRYLAGQRRRGGRQHIKDAGTGTVRICPRRN